jgi:hypothetical protein
MYVQFSNGEAGKLPEDSIFTNPAAKMLFVIFGVIAGLIILTCIVFGPLIYQGVL